MSFLQIWVLKSNEGERLSYEYFRSVSFYAGGLPVFNAFDGYLSKSACPPLGRARRRLILEIIQVKDDETRHHDVVLYCFYVHKYSEEDSYGQISKHILTLESHTNRKRFIMS